MTCVRNINVLLEKPFLHEGHIGVDDSSLFLGFASEPLEAGVESTEELGLLEEVSKVN